MTTGKARKAAIRQRMEQTGEPYNVARHAAEGQRASGDSHLIGDDETRRIAEGFLAASPWRGTSSGRKYRLASSRRMFRAVLPEHVEAGWRRSA
jgi:hypothetical protein